MDEFTVSFSAGYMKHSLQRSTVCNSVPRVRFQPKFRIKYTFLYLFLSLRLILREKEIELQIFSEPTSDTSLHQRTRGSQILLAHSFSTPENTGIPNIAGAFLLFTKEHGDPKYCFRHFQYWPKGRLLYVFTVSHTLCDQKLCYMVCFIYICSNTIYMYL